MIRGRRVYLSSITLHATEHANLCGAFGFHPMKFFCDRCQTKYSIADEKVRRKVLKVRCKTCSNIIEVRESGVSGPLPAMTPAMSAQVLAGSPSPKSAAAAQPAPAAAKPSALGQAF